MVAIGVSGHRDLRQPAAVSGAIDQVLKHILSVYGPDDWTLVSPLAEGADRLVVWRALALASPRLVVPLPLPPQDYQRDFERAESRAAFYSLLETADEVIQMPPQPGREASYLAAGRYVLAHSDVLITIWDGESPRGLGGTGQIVAEARALGLPLAWIRVTRPDYRPAASKPGGPLPVSYEGFPQLDAAIDHR